MNSAYFALVLMPPVFRCKNLSVPSGGWGIFTEEDPLVPRGVLGGSSVPSGGGGWGWPLVEKDVLAAAVDPVWPRLVMME